MVTGLGDADRNWQETNRAFLHLRLFEECLVVQFRLTVLALFVMSGIVSLLAHSVAVLHLAATRAFFEVTVLPPAGGACICCAHFLCENDGRKMELQQCTALLTILRPIFGIIFLRQMAFFSSILSSVCGGKGLKILRQKAYFFQVTVTSFIIALCILVDTSFLDVTFCYCYLVHRSP